MNGFGMGGTWKGYVYTGTFGTTATISPTCGTGGACFMSAGAAVCASGTVAADTTYNSGALLGWNINQAMSTSSASTTVAPVATTGTGLTISFTGTTTNVRVQITDGTTNWCANATGTMMTIPWTMFNTKCWDPSSGMAYTAGTPITAVQLVMPADSMMARPFNWCLVSISEG
jgi:hypothetical protein